MPEPGAFVPPDPGDLRWRVEIQRNDAATVDADAYGDVVPQWVTVGVRWAKIEAKSGRRGAPEIYHAEQTQAMVDYIVTLRYYEGLTAKHRLLWGERAVEINKLSNPDGMKVWHSCEGTEQVEGA